MHPFFCPRAWRELLEELVPLFATPTPKVTSVSCPLYSCIVYFFQQPGLMYRIDHSFPFTSIASGDGSLVAAKSQMQLKISILATLQGCCTCLGQFCGELLSQGDAHLE